MLMPTEKEIICLTIALLSSDIGFCEMVKTCKSFKYKPNMETIWATIKSNIFLKARVKRTDAFQISKYLGWFEVPRFLQRLILRWLVILQPWPYH